MANLGPCESPALRPGGLQLLSAERVVMYKSRLRACELFFFLLLFLSSLVFFLCFFLFFFGAGGGKGPSSPIPALIPWTRWALTRPYALFTPPCPP